MLVRMSTLVRTYAHYSNRRHSVLTWASFPREESPSLDQPIEPQKPAKTKRILDP